MLQDVVDEYLMVLSIANATQDGAPLRGTKHNTVIAYRNDLSQACAYLDRQQIQYWSEVTREHIAVYMLEMRESQAYRPATIARKLAALRAFFRYLRANDLVDSDPLEDFEAPRVTRLSPQTLTPEQMASLFQQIEIAQPIGQRDFAMLCLLYTTGMRVSELVSLDLTDFHTNPASVVCPGRRGRNQRARTLSLPFATVEAMQHYLNGVRPQLVIRHPEEQALFLNHHGERLTRQGFWLIIKGYARQAGITEITPHILRHSFAVLMLQEGMELRSLQELLGHAHISTTQVYCRVVENVV
ncbi:MAG: tyrosine-type recombinase/integrase [Ktedonobacteraceae bacterium]